MDPLNEISNKGKHDNKRVCDWNCNPIQHLLTSLKRVCPIISIYRTDRSEYAWGLNANYLTDVLNKTGVATAFHQG